ncbi:MAG: FAD-binding oxidoreductase [Acidimicrobiia bacterium]|nr:FAD-binding oxidoreductase [Acidimicrobiia bacterium]
MPARPLASGRSTRPMTRWDADAVIVGAGVVGAAVACELTRRGLATVSVERLPGAGQGSTSSSSAIIRFNYSTRAGVAMAVEGLGYWQRWREHVAAPDGAPTPEFVQCGMLMFKVAGANLDRSVEHFEALGVRYEDLDRHELERQFPYLDARRFGPPARMDHERFWAEADGHIDGAVWMPEGGYVTDPMLAAQNLADAAAAGGGRFLYGRSVVEVLRADDRVTGVALDDGTELRAPVVVNVAGPHSSQINRMAGLEGTAGVSTRPMRREVYLVPAPQGLDFDEAGCVVGDLDCGFYLRPERPNNILIGSIEAACDELGWVEDPDAISLALSRTEFETHVLRGARRVRNLRLPLAQRGVVGVYDVTEDWLPIYDRTDLRGFYVAIGTSGNQFKNAAIAAHCMAELILAVEAGHDHDADPLVVHGPHLGLPIDLGTFSRNRPLDADAPVNVLG